MYLKSPLLVWCEIRTVQMDSRIHHGFLLLTLPYSHIPCKPFVVTLLWFWEKSEDFQATNAGQLTVLHCVPQLVIVPEEHGPSSFQRRFLKEAQAGKLQIQLLVLKTLLFSSQKAANTSSGIVNTSSRHRMVYSNSVMTTQSQDGKTPEGVLFTVPHFFVRVGVHVKTIKESLSLSLPFQKVTQWIMNNLKIVKRNYHSIWPLSC